MWWKYLQCPMKRKLKAQTFAGKIIIFIFVSFISLWKKPFKVCQLQSEVEVQETQKFYRKAYAPWWFSGLHVTLVTVTV